MNQRQHKIVLIIIFSIALGLRLILSLINQQANDNHLEPITWILNKHTLPHKENCWECFQPKAYYLLNAGIIKLLKVENAAGQIITLQLVNFVFSFFILLLCWKFIQRLSSSASLRLAAFSLVSMNPALVAINVQATNDTLVILAGVGAIYFSVLFFENKKVRDAILMSTFIILASIVKASGLVIAFSVIAIFILKFLFAKENRMLLKPFFLFLTGFILIVPFAGGYFQNYVNYKTPFVSNINKGDTATAQFGKIRPGITSIGDGYFTFRIAGMLKQPYINGDAISYPSHRTSLWSQLYGRTFFLHFDQYPVSWQSLNPALMNMGRLMLLLALLPLVFFLAGYWKGAYGFLRNLVKRNSEYFRNENSWIHFLFATAFFLFIIKYTWDYRDFSTMKSIFIFPAIPSFIALFINGFQSIKSTAVMKVSLIAIWILTLFSLFDILFLVHQLA